MVLKLKAPNHEKTSVKPMLRDKYSKILGQYSSKVSRSINTRKDQEMNMYYRRIRICDEQECNVCSLYWISGWKNISEKVGGK